MEIFVKVAESGPLPEHARTAIYRVATTERDDVVRVAAWPLIMQDRFDKRESERGCPNALGLNLNKQLVEPETESKPSFVNADEAIREQAVALLNDYLWLILFPLFLAAAALALLHSLGHNSAPPPDRAFPYYMATMVMVIFLLALAIGFHRLRSPRTVEETE